MIARRDFLMGGLLATAAASAAALTPRHHVKFLAEDRKLEAIVPKQIGDWIQIPSDVFVLPKTPGSLSDRLYSQTVTRLYQSPTNLPVMLVMAYGSVQNDLLQLHRPETCYSAVGFQISSSKALRMPLGGTAALPIRELTASSDSRVEPIVYWTRIGDSLPIDGSEQRAMKFRQQIAGIIPDGILVRLSTVSDPTPEVFAGLRNFARTMIQTVAPADRAALVGTTIADQLRGA